MVDPQKPASSCKSSPKSTATFSSTPVVSKATTKCMETVDKVPPKRQLLPCKAEWENSSSMSYSTRRKRNHHHDDDEDSSSISTTTRGRRRFRKRPPRPVANRNYGQNAMFVVIVWTQEMPSLPFTDIKKDEASLSSLSDSADTCSI